ncbi:chemotaxis protein, partial [Massilia phosphatilytica]
MPMKISTRLQLVGWFSAGVAVLTVALLFSASRSVRQELAKNEAAGNVLQAVTALRYLSLEYVLHHAPRTRVQWQLRAASLDRLLTGSADFTASDDPVLLEQLRHTHASVDQLFAQLVANPAHADAAEGGRAVVDERESRLNGQILNKVQSMISDALKLSERSRQGVLAAQQRQFGAVVVFGAAVVLVIAMNTLITLRLLVRPLEQIRQGTALIGAGVHGARAEVLSRDELGQVALEFNRMAQAIEDSQAKELATTNELRAKVDALLDVVSRAARGDLTGTVAIRGEDAIGRLGEGLATMFGDLRSLLNNVQRAGIQVTTSATQIAASARQQEATGIEQAQTTVEVLSTTREISANTLQLLRTMEEATEVADYTTSATTEAQDNLKRMDQSMLQMVAATDAISAKLATLSEKASNINSVLTT